jgi:polyisoprenoid-binding protein YceI
MHRLWTVVFVAWFASSLVGREYKIDRNHSNLGFAAPILGGIAKVRGKFTDFAVKLDFDSANLATSSIRATIKPATIDTGITERDEHLRGPDFFDIARFPEAVFESSSIEKTAGGFVARGKLTIRDITREIDLPFAVTGRFEKADGKGKLETLGFAANCTINRRDFGMLWKHSGEEKFVGDLIDIEILLVTRATRAP